jgi:hypothetical protein
VAVHSADITKIRESVIFSDLSEGEIIGKLNKTLYQSSLQDVYGLRIDMWRLQSWNYGMARLMRRFGQLQWIDP